MLVALGPMLDTAGIWMFKVLIDDVLAPQNFRLFPVVAAAYVMITVAGGAVSFTDDYLTTWVGERFVLDLRTRLFAHLQRLSVGFFERRPLGDVLSRLTSDIDTIEETVVSGLVDALYFAFTIVLYAAALFYLNWQLALAALVAAPLFALIARSFSGRIKKASREKRRRAGSVTAVAEESFGNAALVQAYAREDSEIGRFHRENLAAFTAQMAATRLRALFRPVADLLEAAGVLLVLGLGMWELAHGRITLGGLLVFVVYLTQLYSPVRGIGRLSNSVYAAAASAERVMELLDQRPLVCEAPRPRRLDRGAGVLEVEGLGFAYPGCDQPALCDVGFAVGKGQKLAVVGASGAGKSTLTKLLLRLYDPDTGAIRLDGCDLCELSLADLRRNMAAVLQETLVFDGTIRDNILWGRPGATERDVVRAAIAADADAFIRELPDGYHTRVGQRGRLLSGGQRQRVAIARAMIRNAPVLILDEPTTGLDAESADRILTPLRRLMTGRTTIVIAHNLLTVTDADRILYLDHGRVTGTGTHPQLLATHAGYARLYRLHQQQPSGPQQPGASFMQRSPV
ncbi:ABC transporter ATP-binding protein [Pseudonocardia acidicola]|uniref:ABC transporter ATP-binding protein n=1 Tax=Pseudonocardia acidicola TaxID=2724939 RepID=UPI003B832D12